MTADELDALIERPAWQRDASCREHPELSWYPLRGQSTAAQQAVCAICLVRGECAAAGAFEGHGIWGGVVPSGREVQLTGLEHTCLICATRFLSRKRRARYCSDGCRTVAGERQLAAGG